MELREWLIILGLALVTLIVVDGVRRLQRQRRVPRLDEVAEETRGTDPDEQAREAEINWELPNGGARVVRPADYSQVQPKPKLERQEHPGPSRVLASFRRKAEAFRSDGEAPAAKREPGLGVGEGVADTPADAKAADAKAADAKAAKVKVTKARKDEPVAGAAASVASAEPAAAAPVEPVQAESAPPDAVQPEPAKTESVQAEPAQAETVKAEPAQAESVEAEPVQAERREPGLSALDDDAVLAVDTDEPLAADPDDHDGHPQDDERYRLVDLEGMGDSLKSGSRRVGASVQRFGASLQKTLAERREQKRLEKARREKEKAEKAALDAERQRLAREQAEAERAAREAERRRLEAQAIAEADDNDPLFAPPRARRTEPADVEYEYDTAQADDFREPEPDLAPALNSDKVRVHPVLEKALRHDVSAEHARETLSAASELIVISVMSRDEEGFSGAALLDLMLACGLRYDRDMGVFHRFETEDPESRLQFSMVNVVKPGSFPIKAMDEFRTPGITLLMPLPGADDPSAAFEAMVETAMVIVRHLGGELKDENHSVMTAQTVGFARQRVQEFVRRHRLHRYQVN
ncbi:cell division protein ZipA [Halomonas sp. PGE1]|uniref:cell division protein ZipA n=1 Tax=Halomonas sp. PGE1 TaxID=2730360 RepID=UPI0014765B42|nr:cell division protein ZipA [Halomonas sp. PGE1]QJR00216.1 cell division protein ZipA [Halomonas sp. PGE1]